MAEKLSPYHKFLEAKVPINITSELKDNLFSVNKTISDANELALRQIISGEPLVLLKDASFRSAGYVS